MKLGAINSENNNIIVEIGDGIGRRLNGEKCSV
jgi:hypothetical protein